MKTIWKYLVPMTVAVIALASCNIEIDLANQEQSNKTLHITVKASAEDIKGKADTKTFIDSDGRTILWGTDEYMKLALTAGENTVFDNSNDTYADVWEGIDEAIFEFEVSPGEASSYIYQGIYPASAAVAESNTDPAAYKVLLPATQNATVSSYDPAAYIMVAKPESFNTIQSEWEAWFLRATALNKITLKNVPDGVSIKRVKITAPTEKYLAGARYINLTADADKSTVMGSIYGGAETVEVKYATALSGTSIDVWFTSWDVTVASGEDLGIEVYTANNQLYSRTITVPSGKSITFQEGHLNTLGVSLKDINPTASTTVEDGEYVILAKDGDKYYALKAETAGSNNDKISSVEYTGSTVSYYVDANLVWNVEKSGSSYIISNDSKVIGWTSDNTALWKAASEFSGSNNYLIDIVWDSDNSSYNAKLHNTPDRKFQKNSGSDFFAFYTSSQKDQLLFVPATVDNRGTVTLSFKDDEENVTNAVNLTTAECDAFLGLDLVVSPDNVPAITSNITWTYEDNDGVIYEFDDGTLTLTGDPGTATVTASFDGDEYYRPAEASYTITVSSAAGPQYELVSAANEVVSGDYIITWNNTYYLPSGSTSGTNPAVGTGITVANNKITNTVTSDMVWTFTGDNTNGFTISDGTNILHSTNAAQGISITTDSKRKWTVSVNNDYGMLLNGDDGGTRYLAVYNNATWRYYGTDNYKGVLRLYKLVDNTDWELKSIAVKTEPKKTYEAGENFDPTGLVITATYEDNAGVKADKTVDVAYSNETSSAFTFNPSTSTALTTSDESVSISYTVGEITKSTTQTITVTAPITWDLKSISVTTPPTKTVYTAGESFDPNGMVVTATYENHNNTEQTKQETVDIDNLILSPDTETDLTTGDTAITITYNGISTTQLITVNAASAAEWVETALSDISAGDVFVIVGNNGSNYAMSNDKGTGSAPSAVAVTISGTKLTGSEGNNVIADKIKWNVSGNASDGYVFYPNGSTTTWLYTTTGNNGLRVGDSANKTIHIADNGYMTINDGSNTRYIGIYNSADWRSYTSNGGNIANQTFKFYKYIDNTPRTITVSTPSNGTVTTDPSGTTTAGTTVNITATPSIGYSVRTVSVVDGNSAAVSVTTVDDTHYRFSMPSSDATVTVTFGIKSAVNIAYGTDPAHGSISISPASPVFAGETVTVTATPDDGYELSALTYNDGSDHNILSGKTFTMPASDVTVTATFGAVATISVTNPITNVSATAGTYTINNAYTLLNNATSANVTVAEPDNTVVTAVSKGASDGSISITVSGNTGSARNGSFKIKYGDEAYRTITVNQLAGSTGGTVSFAPSDFTGQGTSGTGSAISATKGVITFACDKGYGTTQFRCYKDGTITISSDGKTITAVSFTFSGSYTGGLSTSYTNLSTTSWTQKLGSQARITALSVTYE